MDTSGLQDRTRYGSYQYVSRSELDQTVKDLRAELESANRQLKVARDRLQVSGADAKQDFEAQIRALKGEVTEYREKSNKLHERVVAAEKAEATSTTVANQLMENLQKSQEEAQRAKAALVQLQEEAKKENTLAATLHKENEELRSKTEKVMERSRIIEDQEKKHSTRMEAMQKENTATKDRIVELEKVVEELQAAKSSSEGALAKLEKEGEGQRQRREKEKQVKVRVEKGKQFYHVVLRIGHLLDAAHGGWPLRTIREEDLRCKAISVTVLGGFNKGKTYIFTRLAEQLCLQSGTAVETEGISIRIAQLQDKRDVMLIDTAGKGQAIAGWTVEKSKEAHSKEEFITQVAHHMAQVYIYVVEFLEEQDQGRLNDLMLDIRATTRHSSTVVVVHNMRNITDMEEWQERKNFLVDLFQTSDASWDHIENVRVPIFGGVEGTVEYLNGNNQRHYFLGCDDAPSGEHNPFVFKSIMDFIGHVGSSDMSVQDRLLQSLNAYIYRHYTQPGTLRIEEKERTSHEDPSTGAAADPESFSAEGSAVVERCIRWFPAEESQGRVQLRCGAGSGMSGGVEPLNQEVQNETRCNIWEMKNNRMVVQIDAPGVTKKDVTVTIKRKNGVTLMVTGNRGPGYCTNGHGDVRNAIHAPFCSTEFSATFSVRPEFQVPNKAEVVQNMTLEDGVLEFEFLPWEDEEDEEDEDEA